MHKNPFATGTSTWTPLGELTNYDAPPDPLVGWDGVPLPYPSSLDAFGISVSCRRLGSWAP